MRLVRAAAMPGAMTIGVDPSVDAALLDLLDHAAAWHRTLAGRRPLSGGFFVASSRVDAPADTSQLAATVTALAQELASAGPDALGAWGVTDATMARARVVAAAAAPDPVEAASALFGGSTVVEGTVVLPADFDRGVRDQASLLGGHKGVLARWLHDSARVRPAAAHLVAAMLQDDVAGSTAVRTWAAQSPAAPYADRPALRAWVGAPFPAALGSEQVTSAVLVGDAATGPLTGIELDAWTEVVPAATGNAAVTANLPSPDARAPNVILIAVPPDVSQPWTYDGLFSVVDEALELAACRMVDLDATRRAPGLVPAAYISEYDPADLDIRQLLGAVTSFPMRWVAEETS